MNFVNLQTTQHRVTFRSIHSHVDASLEQHEDKTTGNTLNIIHTNALMNNLISNTNKHTVTYM